VTYTPDGGFLKDETTTRNRHWIVCLFTSRAYGRYVSKPEIILENSVHAIRDMRQQLEELREAGAWGGKLYSCRFNSGLFNVAWEDSRKVLERELPFEVVVVRRED
jgi:ADP-ribose 1''-phosphate phosphatase